MIEHCWRRAKLIILDFSSGDRLVVQPRFTGAMLVDEGSLPETELRYSTLRLQLADGRAVHYRDVRRLGTVELMDPTRFEGYVGRLGVEPLTSGFTATGLHAMLRASRQPVKKVIMDQTRVVGVGNIYANEALWRAGIDPSRAANRVSAAESELLHEAIIATLEQAIEARGTSLRDYRDAGGDRGDFAVRLAAYGRAGEPCLRCGSPLAGTHAVDGRASVICYRCQR